MKKNSTFLILTLAFMPVVLLTNAALANNKYGPNAVPLSRKSNLEYFQKNDAPDFWALIPYYIPQPNGRACSAANLTWVLNAARASLPLTSEDKLLTAQSFAKDYADKNYYDTLFSDKLPDRSNLTNKNLARLLDGALDKLKMRSVTSSVKKVDVDLKNLKESKKQFIADLRKNEKSANDFIIISLMQGTLTGDPEGGSHVATVGAYDEKKKLVLILDPDREWYEPYWSPVDKVFDAVSDPKSDGINPGWIYFTAR